MWIAFKIVFLPSIHTRKYETKGYKTVVNSFQNCIFTQHSHRDTVYVHKITVVNSFQNCIFTQHSHHLVRKGNYKFVVNSFQNCIFTQHSHLQFAFNFSSLRLWIAFKIVFLPSIHTCNIFRCTEAAVVNSFQNCIFTQHSHHSEQI